MDANAAGGTQEETVQTTLLGLAIALHHCVVSRGLIGHAYFIDWNQFARKFDDEARGSSARRCACGKDRCAAVSGAVAAIAVGGQSAAPTTSAKYGPTKLDVEFSLGSLMRGEWRATRAASRLWTLELGSTQREDRLAGPSTGTFQNGIVAIDGLNLTGRVRGH